MNNHLNKLESIDLIVEFMQYTKAITFDCFADIEGATIQIMNV